MNQHQQPKPLQPLVMDLRAFETIKDAWNRGELLVTKVNKFQGGSGAVHFPKKDHYLYEIILNQGDINVTETLVDKHGNLVETGKNIYWGCLELHRDVVDELTKHDRFIAYIAFRLCHEVSFKIS